jgi:hypothetical protein
MTEDEMTSHPAYLLSLHHATAYADVEAFPMLMAPEPAHYDRHSHDARQAAFALGRVLRAEAAAALTRCQAAGWKFSVDGRFLGRAEDASVRDSTENERIIRPREFPP